MEKIGEKYGEPIILYYVILPPSWKSKWSEFNFQSLITYGIFGALGLVALAYFDERRRSNALIARTSALEETYELLIGNDGSLEGLSQNLATSSNDLKARQDIICEQVSIR